MKLKTTITSTVEKEIELPYYCKQGQLFINVVAEDKTIAVNTYPFMTSIEYCDARYSRVIVGAEPISEKEFNEAFSQAFNVINALEIGEKEFAA